MLRDAFAQAWQVTPHGCLDCSPGVPGGRRGPAAPASCVAERDITRYGDATPDLMYCAEAVVDAFPDARIVQIIRDGRDVAAAMLGDAQVLGFFRRAHGQRATASSPTRSSGSRPSRTWPRWPELSPAGKCAMRWLGSRPQDGPAAHHPGRRAAHHAALRAADPAPERGLGGGVGVHRRADDPIAVRAGPGRRLADRAGRLAAAARARPSWPSSRRSRARSCAGWATAPERPQELTASRGCSWRANWVRYSSAYRPPAASSSSCLPRSRTRPAVDDQDLVGLPDGRQPVRDDQRGPPGQRRLERPLDRRLRLGVQVRGGLVQHHHRRGLEQQPGQRDPLLLAAGQPVAAVAHDGVEPVGQHRDQVPDLRRPAGLDQLGLGGPGPGVAAGWPGWCRGTCARPG